MILSQKDAQLIAAYIKRRGWHSWRRVEGGEGITAANAQGTRFYVNRTTWVLSQARLEAHELYQRIAEADSVTVGMGPHEALLRRCDD